MEEIRRQCAEAARGLLAAAKLKAGDIVIVGCSSSEIMGQRIGSASSMDAARAVVQGLLEVFGPAGVCVAGQCCEHLNRAVVIERAARPQDSEIVSVLPQPHAGGSFATALWQALRDPVAVETIRADAGMDIGDTLIGMHLKRVAVPVRLPVRTIGCARLVCARTRPKFIGGARAVYQPEEELR